MILPLRGAGGRRSSPTRASSRWTGRRAATPSTHDVVIGADGAYSALRDAIVRSERADYRQEHLPWGYKELTIAPDPAGDFALDPGALHIWPRGDSMMIALPNLDRSFTATLFWPFDGPAGFAGLDEPAADPGPLRPRLPRRCRAVRRPRRRVRPQPRRLAGDGAGVAVGAGPAGAARRRRPRHRPVLRAGHELRLRGRRRARPLPRRVAARTGRRRWRRTPSGASRTPTPSPSWRSTTSSRCATRSARPCSGSASGSSTPSSAGRPIASSRCTSWSASPRSRTPRLGAGQPRSAGSRPTSSPSARPAPPAWRRLARKLVRR